MADGDTRGLRQYVARGLCGKQAGGFVQGEQQEQEKPDCELIGQDSNVFNLIGIASRTLRENGMENQAKEMWERITGGDCQSFDQALGIIGEYVNITGPKEPGMEMEGY